MQLRAAWFLSYSSISQAPHPVYGMGETALGLNPNQSVLSHISFTVDPECVGSYGRSLARLPYDKEHACSLMQTAASVPK